MGSLAIGLRGGRSAILPGKSWTEIPTEDEGAEDLVRAVKRGFAVRSSVDDLPAAPASAAAVAPASEEVKPSENVVTSAPADEPSSASLLGSTEKTPENPRRRKG